MAYTGGVQGVGDGTVLGWAWDPEKPEETLDVAIEVDGEVVASGAAGEERDDLIAAKVEGAGHGFRIELPSAVRRDGLLRLRALAGPKALPLPPVPSFSSDAEPGSGWEKTRFEVDASRAESALDRVRPHLPALILAAGMIAVTVALLLIARHFSFFGDEFSFAMKRRGWTPDSFLMAHNGHFVLVSATIYKFLFLIVGMSHSWPYRFVLILFHLACVGLIYVLAEKRFGRWVALFPAGLALFPGASSDDLLWGFQIAFVAAVAFGLGALVCLDREERRFDVAAAVLVFLSLASSAVGLAFAIGILAELIVTRRRRPRLWVALIPFALYGLWFLGFHTSENKLLASNLTALPEYDFHRGGQGFAGFGNLPLALGKLMLVATAIWLLIRAWTERRLPARALTGIVAALAFWSLAGLARAQIDDPVATRYVYPSMIFILVAVIPCLPRVRRVSPQVGVAMAAIVVLAAVNSYAPLSSYAEFREHEDLGLATDYSAEAIANRPGDPWVATVRDLDYPLMSASQIAKLPLEFQLRADNLMVRADELAFDRPTKAELEEAVPARVPELHSAEVRGKTSGTPRCTRVVGTASDALLALPVPAGRELVIVRSGSDPKLGLRVRRLSGEFQRSSVPVPAGAFAKRGSAGIVRVLPDSSDLPWWARIEFRHAIGLCLV